MAHREAPRLIDRRLARDLLHETIDESDVIHVVTARGTTAPAGVPATSTRLIGALADPLGIGHHEALLVRQGTESRHHLEALRRLRSTVQGNHEWHRRA